MSDYRVPQREVAVRMHRHGSPPVSGRMYVPMSAPGGATSTLTQRLNQADERFVFFAGAEGACIVAKSWILHVDLLDEPDRELELPDASAHTEAVCVVLNDGSRLEGEVRYTMPPGRERLLDYANDSRGFVPLRMRDGLTLVHVDHVVAWEV